MTDPVNQITIPKYLDKPELPWMEWVRFKGEECVACVNYERSLQSKKAMVDISYCMTKALNGRVEQTVRFNNKHFSPSLIG